VSAEEKEERTITYPY